MEAPGSNQRTVAKQLALLGIPKSELIARPSPLPPHHRPAATNSSREEPKKGEQEGQRTVSTSRSSAFYRPPTKRVHRNLEGWLWKKGASVLAGWKRRYFFLKDNRLYYSTDVHAEPINYILLTAATEVEVPSQPDPRFAHTFHLRTTYTKRVYVLATADGQQDVERWVSCVREVIKLLDDRYSQHKDFIQRYILPPEEAESDHNLASLSPLSPSTRARGRPRSLPPVSPLYSMSASRPVVDLLLAQARLNTRSKDAVAAGRAGLYLELTLGKQSLRSWVYYHQQHHHQHQQASTASQRLSSPPCSPSTLFPWADLSCTFTEEGAGRPALLDRGRVRVTLWQLGGLGSADFLIDEQWIDLAPLSISAAAVTTTLSFSFGASSSIHTATAGNLTPNSARAAAAPSPASGDHRRRIRRPLRKRQQRARGISSEIAPVVEAAPLVTTRRRWRSSLRMRAVGDLATRDIIQTAVDNEDEEEEVAYESLTDSSDEEDEEDEPLLSGEHEEDDGGDHHDGSGEDALRREASSTASPLCCTVTVRVQKSARAFDKSALLYDQGIASTAIPMRLDTGDIVLFDNSHFLAYGTKFFTMSHWDHVAMVVRWWNNELRLLEATLEGGVELYNFDDRMELLRTVSKVAIRRLTVPRTPEHMDAIYRFIDEVQGRPFQKNRLSMIKAWSGLNTEEDFSSLFCSELTAAAYKRMGLVSEACKTSNNYMPSCWAGKGRTEDIRIPLRPDVRLARKIVFPVIKPSSPM